VLRYARRYTVTKFDRCLCAFSCAFSCPGEEALTLSIHMTLCAHTNELSAPQRHSAGVHLDLGTAVEVMGGAFVEHCVRWPNWSLPQGDRSTSLSLPGALLALTKSRQQ
jgi:hypothetical protein